MGAGSPIRKMNFLKQSIKDADGILLEVEQSVKFLREKGWLKEHVKCCSDICDDTMHISKNNKHLYMFSYSAKYAIKTGTFLRV